MRSNLTTAELCAPNCGTCKFFVRDERPDYKDHGQCRRYPPTLTFGLFNNDIGSISDWNQAWPWMTETEFCGEYQTGAEASRQTANDEAACPDCNGLGAVDGMDCGRCAGGGTVQANSTTPIVTPLDGRSCMGGRKQFHRENPNEQARNPGTA